MSEAFPTIDLAGLASAAPANRHEHAGQDVRITNVVELGHGVRRITLECGCRFDTRQSQGDFERGQFMALKVLN